MRTVVSRDVDGLESVIWHGEVDKSECAGARTSRADEEVGPRGPARAETLVVAGGDGEDGLATLKPPVTRRVRLGLMAIA